ncbi:hypothetical protein D3C85_1038750 [compost metagenome]
MLTLAGKRNVQHFIDLEIFGGGFQLRLAKGLAMGAWTEQFEFGHAGSNRATACTAMPSSRPVKPSFSVVVALTLTWSRSTSRSAAI